MQRMISAVRRALMVILRNEALYLIISFVYVGLLNTLALKPYSEPIEMLYRYLLVPWGVLLCVMHVERALQKETTRADVCVLLVLLAWIIVPFAIRFGATANNVRSWHDYAAVFIALYAMISEASPERRAHRLDLAAGGFALLSFLLGSLLLFCAATGRVYGLEWNSIGFGVQKGFLYAGLHYNITGMVAVCCVLMCLVGVSRRRHLITKAAHLIPAIMMTAVVVLTQSRTARYSLLIALAVGVYAALDDRLPLSRTVHRRAAALAAAVLVAVAGFIGADELNRAALLHYAALEAPKAAQPAGTEASAQADEPVEPGAIPEAAGPAVSEPSAAAEESDSAADLTLELRAAVDATFSQRTLIWKNLLGVWKDAPKYLLIGNGVERTGSLIVSGTVHEANGTVTVHNTYLQFIADFGLIGFALLAAFFGLIARPVWRVFFARGQARRRGGRALGMLVIAIAATGLMESSPLDGLTPMGMMFFFALGAMVGLAREETPGL